MEFIKSLNWRILHFWWELFLGVTEEHVSENSEGGITNDLFSR